MREWFNSILGVVLGLLFCVVPILLLLWAERMKRRSERLVDEWKRKYEPKKCREENEPTKGGASRQ